MNNLKKHFHLIISIALFLLVLPIAYYFLYALPNYNQQKLLLEKQWQEAQIEKMEKEIEIKKKAEDEAKTEKLNNKLSLNRCIQQAEKVYADNWAKACKTQASEMQADYEQCLKDYKFIESTVNQKVEDYCAWRKEGASSNNDCSLSKNRASGIEEYRKQQKDECFKLYGD